MKEPEKSPEELAGEVDSIRRGLDDLVAELDVRRHEMLDWRLQLRRHKGKLALAAGSLLALIGGVVALQIWRHRRSTLPHHKARRMWKVLTRMVRDPEACSNPSVERKLLLAAGSPVAAALGKKLVGRLLA